MSNPDPELSAYRAAVIEDGLFGRARARMFEDVWEGKAWKVDLTTGFLRIGDETFRAQILGTYVAADNTFLWAWANPGATEWEKSLKAAKALRARAAEPGNAVFREQTFSGEWVDPLELAYVSGELAGGMPVYTADTGDATLILLVSGAPQDPASIPLSYMPGVLLEFQQISSVDMRVCADRFFTRLGFGKSASDAHSFARPDGATASIEWGDSDRISSVKLST